MKSLTINIPQGYEVDSFDEKTGQITFRPLKPKDIKERIQSFADVLEAIGPLDPAVLDYHKLCKTLESDHHAIAYQKIVCIAIALNEGWEPDWSNSNELKYYPWFEMRGSSGFRFGGDVGWYSGSDVGSRLCFKSRELAVHAGERFTEIYKAFMVM